MPRTRTVLIAPIAALLLLAGCATPAGDTGPSEPASPATAAAEPSPPPPAPKTAGERPAASAARPAPTSSASAPGSAAAAARPAEQSAGARKLAEGIQLYDKGEFNAAIRLLQAPEITAEPLSVRLSAGKYLAFSYCVTQRRAQCRRAFDTLLRLDRDFALSAVEAGHPLWGPVFEQAKKAAEQAQRAEAARAAKQAAGKK